MENANKLAAIPREQIRISILKMKQWNNQELQCRLADRIESLENSEDQSIYLEIASCMSSPNLDVAETRYRWVKGLFNPLEM